MRNLLELVQNRTKELSKKNSNSFNTSDFMLELLLNKKMDRKDVIDNIITKRLEMMNVEVDKIEEAELDELVQKLYKTSKNGLDTSVSDSQNNSSFSFNKKYEDYELIKTGSILEIVKREVGVDKKKGK